MALDNGSSPRAGEDHLTKTMFGPVFEGAGARFRFWAPFQPAAQLLIEGRDPFEMERGSDGLWHALIADVGSGTRYKFRSAGLDFPDLASRQQDGDAAGWSVVREPLRQPTRREPLRPWHETVICEVHVGTATPEGTFLALRDRLEHFRDAGG